MAFAADLYRHGDRVAILSREAQLTYRELAERVRRTTEALGVGRKLVLIAATNDLEPLVAYLAALGAGHPVILASAESSSHVDALVARFEPDLVLAPGTKTWELVERRTESAHVMHPDLALLLCTSGSTGSAKLVRLSHRNLQANAESIAEYLDIRETDRAATSLPMHYCYGLSVVNSHLLRGAGLILSDLSVVDRCFWEMFHASGGTTFAGVPYTFDLLDRVGFASMSIPGLRYVTQAGGRLAPDRVREYAELGERKGWKLFVMYGQTEATARMAYLPPEMATSHPSAIGVPIPGGSFEIEPLDASSDEGELIYRGPNVMLGYAQHPRDLALGRTIHELRTGDIARRTGGGLYEVVGRRSRFLKLFGLRIDLERAEEVLAQDGVRALCTGDDDRMIVAVDDAQDPERARAIVTREFGIPLSSVTAVHLEALPRLSNGKPDYVAVQGLAGDTERSTAKRRSRERHRRAWDTGAVSALFREVLGCPDLDERSTFVSLGGDSLSYVEMSIALEDALGFLPPEWHTMPVHRLAQLEPRRHAWARIETSVLLRAVAILLVVGTHAGLFLIRGGAHVLLGIAGFNFARFQLARVGRLGSTRRMITSIGRIALPSICWIGFLVAITDEYGPANALLVNNVVGPAPWDLRWRYWYIEVLVQILVVLVVAFSVPAVRRFERVHPYGFGMLFLAIALSLRFDVIAIGDGSHRLHRPQTVLWVFAIGWVAARAGSVRAKAVISVAVLVATAGFFGDAEREAVIAVGLLLLIWLPSMPIVWPVNRAAGLLAAASLYIYLTHWQLYPLLLERSTPAVAVTATTATGIVAWSLVQKATRRTTRTRHRTRPEARVRGAARRSTESCRSDTTPSHPDSRQRGSKGPGVVLDRAS